MITFPNAKINIGLNILSKREDGYHNLQTIFYPVAIKDALEIMDAGEQETGMHFTSTGIAINGAVSDNLCLKAFNILQKDFPQITAQRIHLHKTIPMGAGMGGGSADAAFLLKLLNDKFELNLSTTELMNYALQLGSDCPFFISNKPCFATGRGEILEPVELDLSGYHILIVHPGIHVNTSLAFSSIQPGKNKADLKALIATPVEQWKNNIINDFEEPVFKQYPEIAALKAAMYKNGALYASMSGSGSTVYGLFSKETKPALNLPAHYFYKLLS